MHQLNDGSSKTRIHKIGAIFSTARGIVRSPDMPFGFGIAAADDESKTQQITNHVVLPCQRRRPIAVASAILTSKWKISLKKVKLRLKRTKTATSTEAMELCKKRILMGDKCRTLNLSGVLQYDKHGILLPED
ncbi:hypothetical protein SASPL_102692 [Salvia splendens]|uniref:Uncharacterized protein n=1 Tax=Salvia splendens TaxID=180675 RepID=A0A8X8YT34_SALSN|nr:hypothetical protein SASPL_102692 [Salvia splendens]